MSILGFHQGILQLIRVGVNPKCIDDYAGLKWTNHTKLHIFAATKSTYTMKNYFSPMIVYRFGVDPQWNLWCHVQPKNTFQCQGWKRSKIYFVNFTQPETRNCSKSAAGSLPCCHQVDIRMRSHRLLRGLMTSLLQVINSLAASWLSSFFFYPQAWCKLFQQLAANLQTLNFHRLAATWRSQHAVRICWQLAARRRGVLVGGLGGAQPPLLKFYGKLGGGGLSPLYYYTR